MRNKVEDCRHNPGVGCGEKLNCDRCGWNPAAIAKRKEEVRRDWSKRMDGNEGRSVALRGVLGLLRGQDRVFVIHRMGPHECEGVAEGTVRELRADKCVEACWDRAVKGISEDAENWPDDGKPALVIDI